MTLAFTLIVALWSASVLGADCSSSGSPRFEKYLEEVGKQLQALDQEVIEASSKAMMEPTVLALRLGQMGAYPMPSVENAFAVAVQWPITEWRTEDELKRSVTESFTPKYPYVLRVSIESRDCSYPPRVLMFRQENPNTPWLITDHFIANPDDSVKERLPIPSAETLAKAREEIARQEAGWKNRHESED